MMQYKNEFFRFDEILFWVVSDMVVMCFKQVFWVLINFGLRQVMWFLLYVIIWFLGGLYILVK